MTASIIGVRTPAQLEMNLGALEVEFASAQLDRLDRACTFERGHPHDLLASDFGRTVTRGDMKVEGRR